MNKLRILKFDVDYKKRSAEYQQNELPTAPVINSPERFRYIFT